MPAHQRLTLAVETLFDRFLDPAYAYRFGPPSFDVMIARIKQNDVVLDECFSYVADFNILAADTSKVDIKTKLLDESSFELTICSPSLLQYVNISAKGYLPNDNYFHVSPDVPKTITFSLIDSSINRVKVALSAINLDSEINIKIN